MYAFTGRQVCVLFTHTPWPDMFTSVPSSCSSSFFFTGRTQGREEESLRDDCLHQRRADKRQTSPAGFSAATHPSSFLAIRFLSTWTRSSHLGHLFFWCGPGTTQSTVSHRRVWWGGSSPTPIFPIQQFTSRDNNRAESLRAGRLKAEQQTATWQPGPDYFWLFVVVLWRSRITTHVDCVWVV